MIGISSYAVRWTTKTLGLILLAGLSLLILFGCTRTQKEYFDNGRMKSEIHLKHGHYNGTATWYYENGVKQQEVYYVNDTLQGTLTRWYVNGKKHSVEHYKDNLLDGKLINFDINGKKIKEENYLHDTLHGKSIEYYPSGQPKIEGSYYKGLFDGKWFYFEDDGTLIGLGEFKHGNGRHRAWYRNGPLKREIIYRNNEKHGDEKWFLPDGSPEKIITYDNGQAISVKNLK